MLPLIRPTATSPLLVLVAFERSFVGTRFIAIALTLAPNDSSSTCCRVFKSQTRITQSSPPDITNGSLGCAARPQTSPLPCTCETVSSDNIFTEHFLSEPTSPGPRSALTSRSLFARVLTAIEQTFDFGLANEEAETTTSRLLMLLST